MNLKYKDNPHKQNSNSNDYQNWYYHNVRKNKEDKTRVYTSQNIKAKDIKDYQRQYYIKNKFQRYKYNCVDIRKETHKIPDTLKVHKGKYVITFD